VGITQRRGPEKTLRINVELAFEWPRKEVLTVNWMFPITFICRSLPKLQKSRIWQQRWSNCFVPYKRVGWKISRNNICQQKYSLLNQTILAVEHNLQVSLTS